MADRTVILKVDETSVVFSNLSWEGAWSSGVYAENDAVSHLGKLWAASAAITTEVPGTDVEWVEIPAGANGLFIGTEATVTPAAGDKVALLDVSDSENPKYALFSDFGSGSGISIVSAPVSASATGAVGEFAYDGFYIYMCVATDTWRRWPHQGSW